MGQLMRGVCALALLLVARPAGAEILHLYTSLDSAEADIYLDAFTEDTGIEVRWVRLASGEVLTRLRAEKSRPQASVWYGGPSLEFITATAGGLLQPYQPTTFRDFPKHGHDEHWHWSGIYIGVIGFASNPKVLARRGAAVPTAWQDLLAENLENEVSMAYAYTSGTAYTILASLAQLMGEKEAIAYFDRLDDNVHHYTRSGSSCVTQVGLKEIGTCIAFSHDIVTKGTKRGYPVVLTFPREGTGFEIGSIALVKGGPEPELGRRFIDWALSQRGQTLLKHWNRMPIRNDVPRAEGMPTLAEVNLIDFDAVAAAKRRRELVEMWREVTGQ